MISPARVAAGPAAAHLRPVDHIVVNECGAVNHLYHGAQPDRALAAIAGRTGRQQEQRGAQPLSAALVQVARDLLHGFDGGAILGSNLLFDERKIVPHEIENPFSYLDSESHRPWPSP